MKFFKKHSRLSLVIPVVIIAGILFFITKSRALNDFEIPKAVSTLETDSSWWDNNYAFRRKIILSNDVDNVLKINHAQMVVEGKSQIDGSDLKVVAYDDGISTPVSNDITQPDTPEVYVSFSYQNKNNAQLFLYYGNTTKLSKPTLRNQENSQMQENASTGLEETPQLQLLIQKRWNLIEPQSSLILQVSSQSAKKDSQYYYLIDSENTPHDLQVDSGLGIVDMNSLKPGNHTMFLIQKNGDKITRSNSSTFIASKPIYIAWTVDWEGIDPGKQNMDDLSKFSADNRVKLTHFFNPRILQTVKISSMRKKDIVEWLKDRVENHNDEIAMNLHLQFDMVEETGVNPKFDAKTWDNGLSGYDMPGTVYNYDEYLKIINWGKDKMKAAGLPEPEGFRAGGWFINKNNMKAVKDAGFLYDSSAIKPVELGENKMIQNWKVTATTQPYLVSQNNLDSSDNPQFGIFEIPINGGDEYTNGIDELINNFKANYSVNTYSETSKLIVFSTSPEWYETEQENMQNLFATIANFRYDMDRGPVRFVTLSEWISKNKSE